MEYEIVVSSSTSELVRLVKQYLANGWEPCGGVCANSASVVTYSQVLIKKGV